MSRDTHHDGSRTGGQVVVEALEAAGVGAAFGVPGESYLGILDAFVDSPVQYVSTRHEGGAAFMASAYAKAAGTIGVCMGTRTVGTANMAIGIHNARQDSTPMIAIAGGVERPIRLREAFQETDLVAAMTPLCKWAVEIPTADRLPELMARAVHVATSGRPGPVFLVVPGDVCDERTSEPLRLLPPVAPPHPDPAAVAATIGLLASSTSPVLFAGGGAVHTPEAAAALVEAAEALEVPVITSWRHHDGFPNDHRLYLGSASLGAARQVWERLRAADLLLVVGNRLQENATQGYALPAAGTKVVHVDVETASLGGHAAPTLAVQADATAFLRALTEAARQGETGGAGGAGDGGTGGGGPGRRTARRAANDADRAAFVEATAIPASTRPESDGGTTDGPGVSYPAVLRALATLPRSTIVTSDAGNFFGWLSRHHRFSQPGTYLGPASGAMGYGLPAAIGAKLARPDVPVVSVSGDGGFLMTMQELETAVRYCLDIVAIVLDNARHGTIRMHQEREHPGRVMGTDLTTPDLAAVADAFGARGFRVTADDDMDHVLQSALAHRGPSLVHVHTDQAQLSVDRRL